VLCAAGLIMAFQGKKAAAIGIKAPYPASLNRRWRTMSDIYVGTEWTKKMDIGSQGRGRI
jgi:hypothetical protein